MVPCSMKIQLRMLQQSFRYGPMAQCAYVIKSFYGQTWLTEVKYLEPGILHIEDGTRIREP